MRVSASFWEEHCCECGMPLCFSSCEMFERGWHGRCVRVDGFRESIMGEGRFRFRRWGKVESMWHGSLVSPRIARALERLNGALTPLYRLLGPVHRALRWRLAAALGRAGEPSVWRLRLESVRDERLVAAVAQADGRELVRRTLDLAGGVERTFELDLPRMEKGALFSVFAFDGEATGEIAFRENAIIADAPVRCVKCLAWDLDETLWSGTLAEDGAEGCVLRPESRALLEELDRRGIVNSVVSRNDAGMAMDALRRLGVEEFFVFPQFGWGPKSEGVRNLASELNISVDSIAFVDDREEQRAEVAANAEGARVYDAREIPDLAGRAEFRPPPSPESASRRARYRDEMRRRGAIAAEFGGDEEAFAAASGLSYEFLPVAGETAERCLELVNRTNQLNMSGRRYSHDDFARLLASCEARAVRAWDRYGDYGTVGFAAAKGRRLLELCFSCRVAHKGLERRVLSDIAAGERLSADVRPTERNAPIRRILEEFL